MRTWPKPLFYLFVIVISTISGCADELLLPNFDGGALNPDIRFLRAAEVISGVKCAMVSFLSERERELIAEREEDYRKLKNDSAYSKIESGKQALPHPRPPRTEPIEPFFARFQLYAVNATWQPECPRDHHFAECKSGDPGCRQWALPCNPKNNENKKVPIRCVEKCPTGRPHCGDYFWDTSPQWGICKVNSGCNAVGGKFWDYALKSAVSKEPLASREFKASNFRGCVPVPDYSRFALDSNSDSTIQLTLVGTNSGFINYNRIDATRLPSLLSFVVPGGGAKNAPFPQFQPTLAGTTTFDMSVKMPQGLEARAQPDPYPPLGIREEVTRYGGGQQIRSDTVFVQSAKKLIAAPFDRASAELLRQAKDVTDSEILGNTTIQSFRDRSRPATDFNQQVLLRRTFENAQKTDPFLTLKKDLPQPGASSLVLRDWMNALEQAPDKIDRGSAPSEVLSSINSARQDLQTLDAMHGDLSKVLEKLDARAGPNKITETLLALGPLEQKAILLNNQQARDQILAAVNAIKRDAVLLSSTPPISVVTQFSDRDTRELAPPSRSPLAEPLHEPARQESLQSIRKLDPNVAPDEKARMDRYCAAGGTTITLDDQREIDYLALKKMLHNVVRKQNDAIYRGRPDVTLDTLNLTTKFQLTLEFQAGTKGIFRIVPLLSPPNMEAKFDHAHTLKITLNGLKRKGDPNLQQRLIQNCYDRMQNSIDRHECSTTQSQLLESIIEAVEDNQAVGSR